MLNKKVLICGALSLALIIGSFMGIENYKPEDRSLDIGIMSEAVSVDSGTNKNTQKNKKEEYADLNINAKSAILMDYSTGSILYAQNENEELPPASVTKIMTMLLTLEAIENGKIALTDKVTISEKAASMGGSQMFMEVGEEHTVEELLKGISIVSANDACVAVSEYVAGTMEIFVENMNKRAKELKMENTNFVNTNGLPIAEHYTSAKDIAIMSRELMKYTMQYPWFTTWQDTITIGLPGKEKEFGLTNTNKLIKQYKGAIGIKTGFTQEAGYCLSGAAKREDMVLIAVVMGCKTSNERTTEISRLLDYGFATYDSVSIAKKDEKVSNITIEKGVPEKIDVLAIEDMAVLVKKGESDKITSKVILKEKLSAPINKGDKIGDLLIYKDGKKIKTYDLIAKEDVKKANVIQIYRSILENFVE